MIGVRLLTHQIKGQSVTILLPKRGSLDVKWHKFGAMLTGVFFSNFCCDPQTFSKCGDFENCDRESKNRGQQFNQLITIVKLWKRAFGDRPLQKRGSIDWYSLPLQWSNAYVVFTLLLPRNAHRILVMISSSCTLSSHLTSIEIIIFLLNCFPWIHLGFMHFDEICKLVIEEKKQWRGYCTPN